jgi:hypothetical protein
LKGLNLVFKKIKQTLVSSALICALLLSSFGAMTVFASSPTPEPNTLVFYTRVARVGANNVLEVRVAMHSAIEASTVVDEGLMSARLRLEFDNALVQLGAPTINNANGWDTDPVSVNVNTATAGRVDFTAIGAGMNFVRTSGLIASFPLSGYTLVDGSFETPLSLAIVGTPATPHLRSIAPSQSIKIETPPVPATEWDAEIELVTNTAVGTRDIVVNVERNGNQPETVFLVMSVGGSGLSPIWVLREIVVPVEGIAFATGVYPSVANPQVTAWIVKAQTFDPDVLFTSSLASDNTN